MIFETERLQLEDDGDVYLIQLDADGERDFRRIGHVDDCGHRVPDELDDEFEEAREAWAQAVWERRDYENGIPMMWGRS